MIRLQACEYGQLYVSLLICFSPRSDNNSRIGASVSPSFVREYSTLGGTSLYYFRLTNPLASSPLSCLLRVLWAIGCNSSHNLL